MTAWLGIGILLAFSLALNLFMRLEHKAEETLPEELKTWRRVLEDEARGDVYLERRVVELESRWFTSRRWVEQRRLRRADDDSIVQVLEERPFRRG